MRRSCLHGQLLGFVLRKATAELFYSFVSWFQTLFLGGGWAPAQTRRQNILIENHLCTAAATYVAHLPWDSVIWSNLSIWLLSAWWKCHLHHDPDVSRENGLLEHKCGCSWCQKGWKCQHPAVLLLLLLVCLPFAAYVSYVMYSSHNIHLLSILSRV